MAVGVFGLKNNDMFGKLFRKEQMIDPQQELADWEAKGRPLPPPHIVKQNAISEYRAKYDLKVLVETGTYLGDMVEAQKQHFTDIYSIELSERLYKQALKRFKGDNRIHLLQGDSGKRLKEIVSQLKQPALFWLDGHYSGGITALGDKECPVPEELEAIFKSNEPHVILIDDARMFNGTQSYPTLAEIKGIVDSFAKNYSVDVKDDIIRLIPKL
jgi:hypothetical protein